MPEGVKKCCNCNSAELLRRPSRNSVFSGKESCLSDLRNVRLPEDPLAQS